MSGPEIAPRPGPEPEPRPEPEPGPEPRQLSFLRRHPFPVAWSKAEHRLDLVLTMTLVLLLVYTGGRWFVHVPTVMLVSVALLWPQGKRSAKLWFVLGVVLLAGYAQEWSLTDNHKYLAGYWCLALYCAFRSSDAEQTLAISARWLIALCFTFATLWKILSPDFLDTRCFQFILLVDRRFETLLQVVGRLSTVSMEENRQAVRSLLHFQSTLTEAPLVISFAAARLARVLTYGAVLLEGLVALAFLLPAKGRAAALHLQLRHLLLLAFVVSTYAIAPVLGFGWLLLIMGLAQIRDDESGDHPPIAWAYPATFLFLQLYRIPWGKVLGL